MSWSRLSQLAAWTVVAVGLSLSVWELRLFWGVTPDDTFISLRYATNAAAGHGLVYNLGERVEGYSNPLIVLFAVAAFRLGLSGMTAVKLLGIASYVLVALALAKEASRFRGRGVPHALLVLLPVTFVCSTFGMAFYATSGLETVVAGAALLAIVLLASRESGCHASAWLCLTVLCYLRPEGPAYAAVPIAALALERRARGGIPWRRHLSMASLLFLLPVVVGLLLRHEYYGAWLPNTFLAKLPWTHGARAWPLRGLDDIAVFSQATMLPVLLVLVAFSHRTRPLSRRAQLSAAALVVALAFQKYAGGDWMIGARFLVPAIPVAGLLWVEAARPFAQGVTASRTGTAAVLVAAVLLLVARANAALEFRASLGSYPQNVMNSAGLDTIGRWIGEHASPGWRIVNWRIGAIGYYSGCYVLDTWGLVSRDIALIRARELDATAANARVRAYVAARAPELMMSNRRCPPEQLDYEGIAYSRVFEADVGNEPMQVYARNDKLSELRSQSVE